MTTDKRQLSDQAGAAIRAASRAGGGVAVADTTLWEIAMIAARGSIRLPGTLTEYLRYLESVFIVLPITSASAELSVRFPDQYPKNPADRIIGATAVVHKLQLATKDDGIRASGEVNCVW